MGSRQHNLIGQRFGSLVVQEFVGVQNNKRRWRCTCDCGREHVTSTGHLNSGHDRSCGCARTLNGREPEFHGLTGSRIARCWQNMVGRCTRPSCHDFKNYGARGIKVCDRWRTSLATFVADMGMPPTDTHEIDRIDVNGHYEPGNCRWVTRRENLNNKRTSVFVEWDGRRQTVAQWAQELGFGSAMLGQRLKHGWPVDKAMTVKASKRNPRYGMH